MGVRNLLNKKPETLTEKLENLWFNVSYYYYYYPRRIRYFWWGIERYFRNLWRYRKFLWSDNDFDYGYLDEIIYTKLQFMKKYFEKANIAEDSEKYSQEINLALRLADIFMEKEVFEGDEIYYSGYVNTQNIKRFFPSFEKNGGYKRMEEDDDFQKITKTELRMKKAKNCFLKILREKEEYWWD